MTNKRKEPKITSLERLEILKEREKGYKASKEGFTAPPGVIHYCAKKTRILDRLLGKPKRELVQGCKKVSSPALSSSGTIVWLLT